MAHPPANSRTIADEPTVVTHDFIGILFGAHAGPNYNRTLRWSQQGPRARMRREFVDQVAECRTRGETGRGVALSARDRDEQLLDGARFPLLRGGPLDELLNAVSSSRGPVSYTHLRAHETRHD